MATKFIPTIAKADYEAIRRIIRRHLPDSYDKWLYLSTKESADNISKGGISEPVEVNADEFARFLKATRADANLHSLYNYAYEKGMGHKY